jgi:hypothetical protein
MSKGPTMAWLAGRNDAATRRWPPTRGLLLATLLALGAAGQAGLAAAAEQKTFASPEAAAKALVEATRNDDVQEILAILGPDAKDIVSSGDAIQDKAAVAHFAVMAQQMMRLDPSGDGEETLSVGGDNWPFPIPIMKQGDAWLFDTAAGEQEILNRRIGRNELSTIDVCRAFVDAQRNTPARTATAAVF